MPDFVNPWARSAAAVAGLALLGACTNAPLDLDFRGNFADVFDTSEAARAAAQGRPRPDDRGVISYPDFQVAVARPGDRVSSVAARVGLPAEELARYNGLEPESRLREGEVLSLPRRVAEPSPATGADGVGPIRPDGEIDITTLAGDAIERADADEARTAESRPQTGMVPVQHQVQRGETAYSIARLYNVSVRSLADWNALDSNLTVREGQYLLIPVARAETPAPVTEETVAAPGTGSATPTPPSASQPLPEEDETDVAALEPESPALGAERTEASGSGRLTMPVDGPVIEDYEKGRNDGIGIAAPAGTPVRAAGAGTVAAITRDTDQIPILVLRHQGNLLTVYANIQDIRVEKGDRVSAGQTIAAVRAGDPSFLHFEVREGFESVDPVEYLN